MNLEEKVVNKILDRGLVYYQGYWTILNFEEAVKTAIGLTDYHGYYIDNGEHKYPLPIFPRELTDVEEWHSFISRCRNDYDIVSYITNMAASTIAYNTITPSWIEYKRSLKIRIYSYHIDDKNGNVITDELISEFASFKEKEEEVADAHERELYRTDPARLQEEVDEANRLFWDEIAEHEAWGNLD